MPFDWFALRLEGNVENVTFLEWNWCLIGYTHTHTHDDGSFTCLRSVKTGALEKWTILTLSLNIINWKPIKWEQWEKVDAYFAARHLQIDFDFVSEWVSECFAFWNSNEVKWTWWDLNLNFELYSIHIHTQRDT